MLSESTINRSFWYKTDTVESEAYSWIGIAVYFSAKVSKTSQFTVFPPHRYTFLPLKHTEKEDRGLSISGKTVQFCVFRSNRSAEDRETPLKPPKTYIE